LTEWFRPAIEEKGERKKEGMAVATQGISTARGNTMEKREIRGAVTDNQGVETTEMLGDSTLFSLFGEREGRVSDAIYFPKTNKKNTNTLPMF